jgi:RNA polymerase sigma factor (TIGR02999 family)
MRRILVDRARKKGSLKHGGDRSRVELFDIGTLPDDGELLALDEALRKLAEEDPLAAEVVNLKFFAGVSREAIAEMTGLTIHEVRTKWAYARAWLQVAINQRI